jgi:hypothetical protein
MCQLHRTQRHSRAVQAGTPKHVAQYHRCILVLTKSPGRIAPVVLVPESTRFYADAAVVQRERKYAAYRVFAIVAAACVACGPD